MLVALFRYDHVQMTEWVKPFEIDPYMVTVKVQFDKEMLQYGRATSYVFLRELPLRSIAGNLDVATVIQEGNSPISITLKLPVGSLD